MFYDQVTMAYLGNGTRRLLWNCELWHNAISYDTDPP